MIAHNSSNHPFQHPKLIFFADINRCLEEYTPLNLATSNAAINPKIIPTTPLIAKAIVVELLVLIGDLAYS